MPAPAVTGAVYPSPCQPSTRLCVNGGSSRAGRCLVHTFAAGQLVSGVTYWVDSDPQYPGVYYAKVSGGCPYGGAGAVNCQLVGLASDVLETGVSYVVDRMASPPGVYYTPDFAE